MEIQQAVVGLQSLYKASTSQPKVNTSRPIQTKVYRKSSVQGFASNRTKARQKRKQDRKSGNTTNSCRAAKPLQGQHESKAKVNTRKAKQTKPLKPASKEWQKRHKQQQQQQQNGNTTRSCLGLKSSQGQCELTKSRHAQGNTDDKTTTKASVQGIANNPAKKRNRP